MNSMAILRLNRKRKAMIIRNTLIVVLIAISVFFIVLWKKTNNNIKININKMDIVKYVEYTESMCKENYILDWREIISVYSVTKKGSITEEAFKEIGVEFYIYKDNKIVGIKSFDEVLRDLKIIGNESIRCKYILKGLQEESIYENLYIEKDKVDFIKRLEAKAYKNYDEFGILPSITISQGIIESGWGKSKLAIESNNIFGIKADSRWSGKTYKISSKENYDEEYVSAFRSYDSIGDSIEDHGKFLSENMRYKENGLFDGENYLMQAQALENAGYSTAKDSNGELIYSDKLVRVIRDYNLMSYDVNAIRKQFRN